MSTKDTWNKNVRKLATNEDKHQRMLWLDRQFDRYLTFWRGDIERYISNGKMAWGINYGQWPQYVVERLLSQGRRPPTYNVTFDKLESLIGSTLGNGWDIKYDPVSGILDSLTLRLMDMYKTDQLRLKWAFVEMYALLDCYIAVAYERMVLSDQHHWLGNLGWEALNPRHTLLSPCWKTNDPNDIMDYYTYSMMTAEEIMATSPDNVSQALKELCDREKKDGVDYGEFETFSPYGSHEEKWGSRHRVIEFHWVTKVDRWWEYDYKNHCLFPETGYPVNSDEDKAVKASYAKTMGLSVDEIGWVKQKKKVKYIQRVCPTIDKELFLIDGKDRIQANNCNILPLGMRYEGQFMGIVDRIKDINVAINKGELNIDEIHARSAKSSFAIDKALAGEKADLMERIENGWNEVGAKIWVENTAELGPTGGIIKLPESSISSDSTWTMNHRYDMVDRLSKVSAAQDARTENAGEPALLFQNKVEISMMGQRFYNEIIKNHKVLKAQMYAVQAKITYAGYPRQGGGVGGIEPFVINQRGKDALGSEYIMDDFSQLPEMNVLAIPSKNGATVRMQMRSQYVEIMQFLNADPRNRLLSVCATGAILGTIDMPEDQKKEFDQALKMVKMEAALQTAGNIVEARAKIAQAEGMVAQMMGQQPPQQVPAQNTPVPRQASFKEVPAEEGEEAGTTQQTPETEEQPQPVEV